MGRDGRRDATPGPQRERKARAGGERTVRAGGVSHVYGAPRVVRASLTRFWGARVLVGWEDGGGGVGVLVRFTFWGLHTASFHTLEHTWSHQQVRWLVDGSRQLTADLEHHGGGGGRA